MAKMRAMTARFAIRLRRSTTITAATVIIALAVVSGLWLNVGSGGGGAVQAQTACETGGAAPDGGGLARDCSTLLGLKPQLAGTATLNWSADLAIANWDGIRVGGFPKRVTRLHLHAKGLTGTIPAALAQLDELEHLNLERNQLTGSIPGELGRLGELTNLALGQNKLTGAIPAEIAKMPKLGSLYLRFNQLSGGLPEGLGTSGALWLVSVDHNSLTGALPASLSGLSVLWVSGNKWSCAPPALLKVRNNDLAGLSLSGCTEVTPTPRPSATATATPTSTPSPTATATPQTHTLTLSAGAGGSLSASPAGDTHAEGTAVTVTATPADGYKLSSWGDDCAATPATSTTCSLTMDGDRTASAVFSEKAAPAGFSYSTYDTTGQAATAGSYAFLAGSGASGQNEGAQDSATSTTMATVTTYEGLRTEADTLRIHLTDGSGVSRASFFGTVQAGHLIEWRHSDSCFVRYRVTAAPASGSTASYREFGLRPETYVFQGCQDGSLVPAPSGDSQAAASSATSAAMFTAAPELPLGSLGGLSLEGFAVVHGPWQLIPYTQAAPGALGSPAAGIATVPMSEPPVPAVFDPPSPYRAGDRITSLAEARRIFPYWRDPALPASWAFHHLYVGGGLSAPGYEADFYRAGERLAVRITAKPATVWPLTDAASWLTNHNPPRRIVQEFRVIAGRPAVVDYSPLGPQHLSTSSTWVTIYDAATQTIYGVEGVNPSLQGGPAALERVIVIARSLFESPNPQ